MKKIHIIFLSISLLFYLTTSYIIGTNYPESNFYTIWLILGLYCLLLASILIGILTIRYKKSILIFSIYSTLIPFVILIVSFLVSFKLPDAVILMENSQGESVVNETYSVSTVVGGYGLFSLFFIIPFTIIGLIYLKFFNLNKTK